MKVRVKGGGIGETIVCRCHRSDLWLGKLCMLSDAAKKKKKKSSRNPEADHQAQF